LNKSNHTLFHYNFLEVDFLKPRSPVQRYIRCEAELISVLQEIDGCHSYHEYQCTSLFNYAVDKLGVTRDVAYNFVNVARKAKAISALQAGIQDGSLTVSKVKKVTSVITLENQDHWIGLVKSLPKEALEKEVARVNPKVLTPERAQYVAEDRMRLELGVSEALMKKLRRVQDLLAQSQRRPVSLEETLDAMAEQFIERNDPLEKAKRAH